MKRIFIISILLLSISAVFAVVSFQQKSVSIHEGHPILKPKKIIVLPLGRNLSSDFIHESFNNIQKVIPGAQLRSTMSMPSFAYYAPRARYRADSLISWMSSMAKPDEVYIGITNLDISTTKDNYLDWGVMGLGYRPGNACIASQFRLKNKTSFWKVALHELGHTAGLDHCPVKSCLMRDAEGKDHTDEEKEFCPSCKHQLLLQGWNL